MKIERLESHEVASRFSLIRLSEAKLSLNVDIERVNNYLKGISSENKKLSDIISQSDRCMNMIEGVYKRQISVFNEDVLITLLTIYPQNMIEQSLFKTGFSKSFEPINKAISICKEKNLSVYQGAREVLKAFIYCDLAKSNTLAATYLVANLMIANSGDVIVLEDTDTVSSCVQDEIKRLIDKRCLK